MRMVVWLGILTLLVVKPAIAANLGKRGQSFSVIEEGIITMLKSRLAKVDIHEHQRHIKERAKKQVLEPKTTSSLPRAARRRQYSFDPSITLQEDAKLPCGRIIVPAGTKVNPLEKMEFDRRLWFIDGRDAAQVTWLAEKLQEASSGKLQERIILTAGRPLDIQERLRATAYFDQGGVLATKFGLKALPAVVEADGLVLKITEEDITEEAADAD